MSSTKIVLPFSALLFSLVTGCGAADAPSETSDTGEANVATATAASTQSQCGHGYFWMHGQCWREAHDCSEYNYTNHDVCNNPHDHLRCDWDHSSSRCYSEGGHHPPSSGGCHPGQFWMHGQCWNVSYSCDGYNYTNHDVCNNPHDSLQCDWNPHTSTCYPEHH